MSIYIWNIAECNVKQINQVILKNMKEFNLSFRSISEVYFWALGIRYSTFTLKIKMKFTKFAIKLECVSILRVAIILMLNYEK